MKIPMTETVLHPPTIDDTRAAIAAGTTTATALAEHYYRQIESRDGEIGAFLTLCKERAFVILVGERLHDTDATHILLDTGVENAHLAEQRAECSGHRRSIAGRDECHGGDDA